MGAGDVVGKLRIVRDRQMTPTYTIRAATISELDVLMDLFARRVRWLEARGSDQWANYEAWRPLIAESVNRGCTRVAADRKGAIHGTITVSSNGNPRFWTAEELYARDSLYLSKLTTDVDTQGRELGALLLAWSANYAHRLGKKYVRLDAWRSATGLHQYYKEREWEHIRTIDTVARGQSGALFQKAAAPIEMP